MPRKNIIFLVAGSAAVVIGAIAVFFFMRPSLERIDVNRGEPGEAGPVAQVPQISATVIRENTGAYSVEVEYPELQGISALGVKEKINGDISTEVYNKVAAFRSANSSNSTLGDPAMKSSLEGNFDALLLTKSFFSALMSYSDYSAGAAHPNNYLAALNYSLKDGSAVSLEQFLRSLNPSPGYMSRLGQYVKKDLVRQLGNSPDSLVTIEAGAVPNGENYAHFTLDKAGISIHFDPYQVAPSAAGSPEVKLSYDALIETVIKPENPGSASSSAKWWLE